MGSPRGVYHAYWAVLGVYIMLEWAVLGVYIMLEWAVLGVYIMLIGQF